MYVWQKLLLGCCFSNALDQTLVESSIVRVSHVVRLFFLGGFLVFFFWGGEGGLSQSSKPQRRLIMESLHFDQRRKKTINSLFQESMHTLCLQTSTLEELNELWAVHTHTKKKAGWEAGKRIP